MQLEKANEIIFKAQKVEQDIGRKLE